MKSSIFNEPRYYNPDATVGTEAEMKLPSAEEVRKGHGRLTYQEAMSLISLPDKVASGGDVTRRYMSRRSAWIPGVDFVPLAMELGTGVFKPTATYGGHVYSQAGLAASLSFRAAQKAAANGGQDKKFGIHVRLLSSDS